jgi:hypothetical protein
MLWYAMLWYTALYYTVCHIDVQYSDNNLTIHTIWDKYMHTYMKYIWLI